MAAKIDHTAVYVKDLEGMKEFYIRYFGAAANELYHNPRTGLKTYFLSFGGEGRLELMNKPGIKEREGEDSHGYIHLAFALPSREAVDDLTKELKEAGFSVVSGPRVTGDGYYESCILDPEGNKVELVGGNQNDK